MQALGLALTGNRNMPHLATQMAKKQVHNALDTLGTHQITFNYGDPKLMWSIAF